MRSTGTAAGADTSKGAYDRVEGDYQFLVAGSSRLDYPQRRGDSLAGRYYLLHLWPFTQAELGRANLKAEEFFGNPQQVSMERHAELTELWQTLSEQSGFPEPFLSGRKTSYRRWSSAYAEQLIREDIRDLTGIKAIGEMETLYHLLPAQVGQLLSVPALAQGLQVAYNTIRSWLLTLQRFFAIFSLAPWSRGVPRAIREGQKIYLWDVPRVQDPGARFENMVALELCRAVSNWNEMGYGRFSLHFIRTKDQQEVDFVIVDDGRPVLLVDAQAAGPSAIAGLDEVPERTEGAGGATGQNGGGLPSDCQRGPDDSDRSGLPVPGRASVTFERKEDCRRA